MLEFLRLLLTVLTRINQDLFLQFPIEHNKLLGPVVRAIQAIFPISVL